jgi:hypothetical protein
MSEIVFLLEEPSAEAMLDGLLPRLLPTGVHARCIVFEGKQDLEKQLVRRIRGYRVPGSKFVVLRDQDAGDCQESKKRLAHKCTEAGKPDALVRIACHELECWYLADLSAVEKGLGLHGLTRLQNKNPYRAPDSAPDPYGCLVRLAPVYQNVAGSRAIGPYLDTNNTRSHSFAVFVAGLRRLTAES